MRSPGGHKVRARNELSRRSLSYLFSLPAQLIVGLVLLSGRYDWSNPATLGPQRRGYLCSAFFFVLTIPTFSAVLGRLVRSAVLRGCILGATVITFCAPYRWLGLQHLYYYATHPAWVGWRAAAIPRLIWFPSALWAPPQIPGELVFFPSITAVLLGTCWIPYFLKRRSAVPPRAPVPKFRLLVSVLILLVVGQTWMHLSMRSPYTYICHFEQPESANYWYHVYLFPEGKGAVNADYFVFRALEDVFIGTPEPLNGMLVRRPFPFYLSSQLSYFCNAYYVILISNICIWLVAALALFDFATAHFGEVTGMASALLAAAAPGFIMYAAQPQTYLWGYAAAMIVVWAQWRICAAPAAGIRQYVVLGAILGIALLTYDLFAVIVYLIAYQLLTARPAPKLFLSIVIALVAYAVFGALVSRMPGVVPDVANSKYLANSLRSAAGVVASNPISWKSYELYGGFLSNYMLNLGNTVFVFPLLFAVVGAFCFVELKQIRLVGALLLPSVVNYAVLYFGQTELATYPRFVFVAYPAIYIMCGIALAKLGSICRRRGRALTAAMWIASIGGNLVLTNADVFGHPWLYYLFYYQRSPATFASVERDLIAPLAAPNFGHPLRSELLMAEANANGR